jgi:hypothetical protein
MRIGLDLDNTLACHDATFLRLDWLAERGWETFGGGGRNNRLFRVSKTHRSAALKIHRRTAGDSRDRFATEKAFYALARLPPIQLEKARAVLARGAEFLK